MSALVSDWRYEPINRHDTVTIRIIWVAFALSLLVHLAWLWTAPPLMRPMAFEPSDKPESSQALIAQLAPRASPPESAAPPPSPPPPARTAPPPSRIAPRPVPPPVARIETVPGAGAAPPPRPTPPAEAQPPRPPAQMDLSAYIAAQRNARGEPAAPSPDSNAPNAPPVESEKESLNRRVAANLGLNTTPTFGDDPKRSGGVFAIRRIGYDDAEFYFNGWSQDIGRVARQLIEVRKGTNPDIRIAMVRKMIEIIRANVSGDFIWVSRRMNRNVPLSARPSDNAELEQFMMREFFAPEQRQP